MSKRSAIIAILASAVARIGYSDQINFTLTPTTPTTIAPGGSFGVDVSLVLAGADQALGVSYFMQVMTVAGSGHFQITQRTGTAGSPFSVVNTPDATLFDNTQPLNTLLNQQADSDLGARVVDFSAPVGAGTRFLSHLVITADALVAPGTYQFGLADPPLLDVTNFATTDSFPAAQLSAGTFTITVAAPVPEPAGLLALGGLIVAGFAVRRRMQAA